MTRSHRAALIARLCLFALGTVCASAVLLSDASLASAQDVRVEMSANRSDLTLNDNVVVRVFVQLQSSEQPSIQIPDFPGFQIVQRSVQRPMQFSFGFGQRAVVSSSVEYLFVLAPQALGKVRIQPARVTLGKHVYQSAPLTLNVSGGGGTPGAQGNSAQAVDPNAQPSEPDPNQNPAAANSAPAQAAAPAAPQASGDVSVFDNEAFLRTVVDKIEPYEGEQVTATIYLYVRRNLQQVPSVQAEATTDGFWTRDLLDSAHPPEPSRQAVSGRAYWVYVLRRFAAFPLRSGELTIGAMSLTISRDSIFDLFDPNNAQANLQRTGVPVLIKVKALPVAGKPNGEIAVGNFEVTAQLDRAQAVTGDAVTLTATVKGIGNLGSVKLADPVIAGLQILQPEAHEMIESPRDLVQGTRSFAWLMVPNAPGDYAIPSLGFDEFNPADQQYHHVASAPLTLTAAGNAKPNTAATTSPTTNANDETQDADKPQEESWPTIRTRSALARSSRALADQPFYAWALAIAPLLWLLGLTLPALRKRAEANRLRGGPKEALRSARARLSAAEDAAKANDARLFHAEISNALHGALQARLGEPMTGFTRPQLRTALGARGLPEQPIEELSDVLERCDFARFSSAAVSSNDMQQLLARSRALFDELARFSPSGEVAA